MRIHFLFLAIVTIITLAHTQLVQATPPSSCTLASEGIYKGWWVKHRIVLDENVVYGANDVDSILMQLENLRGQGLCR